MGKLAVTITNDMVAQAIMLRYGSDDVMNTLNTLLTSSYKVKDTIWKSICRDILKTFFPNVIGKTVDHYVSKCFSKLRHNREIIKSIIEKANAAMDISGDSDTQFVYNSSPPLPPDDNCETFFDETQVEEPSGTSVNPDDNPLSANSCVDCDVKLSPEFSNPPISTEHIEKTHSSMEIEEDFDIPFGCSSLPPHSSPCSAPSSGIVNDTTSNDGSVGFWGDAQENDTPADFFAMSDDDDDVTSNGRKNDVNSNNIREPHTAGSECSHSESLIGVSTKIPPKLSRIEKKVKRLNKEPSQKGRPITLKAEFWAKYWTGGKRLRKIPRSKWTDDFNHEFAKVYPYCVLSFEWHKCYEDGGKKEKYFEATAVCKHEHCINYKFTCNSKICQPFTAHKVAVQCYGEFRHEKGEGHRRFISGVSRDNLADKMKGSSSYKKKLESMNSSNVPQLQMGNLNETPSLMILQKIHSDEKCKNDLSTDPTEFINKLIEEFEVTWKGQYFNNFIQQFSVKPFYLSLFTEVQLKVLLSEPIGKVFCAWDSTGKIVEKPPGVTQPIYYYTIILPGRDDKGPFPVAEFISAAQSVPPLASFLLQLDYSLRLMSSRNPVIDKLESDFSLALLQAASLALNKLSLIDYINFIFRNEDQRFSRTVLHICSTHLLRTGQKKLVKLGVDKKQVIYRIASRGLTMLIHSDTLDKAKNVFTLLVKIFMLEMTNKERDSLIQLLMDFAPLNPEIEQSEDTLKEGEQEEEVPEQDELRGFKVKDSLYYEQFLNVYNQLLEDFPCANAETCEYYQPGFILYLLNTWMPYFPLWSALVIKQFNILRDSTSSVENWHRLVKHLIFGGEKKILAARFAQQQEKLLPNRLIDRDFSLETERQKLKPKSLPKERTDETAEEFWQRYPPRHGKGKNTHFTIPKTPAQKKDSSNNTGKGSGDDSGDDETSMQADNSDEPNEKLESPISDDDDRSEHKSMEKEDDDNSRTESLENDELNLQSRLREVNVRNAREILFSRIATYPEQIEQPINIRGFPLDKFDLLSLQPNQDVDDNILNAFAATMVDSARATRNAKVVFIDTLVTGNLILGKLSDGFKRYLIRCRLAEAEYWILPLHLLTRHHWILMIVDTRNHMLLLIDSMRRKRSSLHIFNSILSLVNIIDPDMAQSDPPWTYYCPRDVPCQEDGTSCGIHVCIWMYIACTSLPIEFNHEDTLFARVGISKILMDNLLTETDESVQRNAIHAELLDTLFSRPEKHPILPLTIHQTPPRGSSRTVQYVSDLLLQ